MLLALLGILFAVMSLVAFGNISAGMKQQIIAEMSKFGKNLIILRSGLISFGGRGAIQFGESQDLKIVDIKRIRESLSGVNEVVPFFDISYPARYKENQITVNVIGASSKVFQMKNIVLIMGSLFSEEDNTNREKKAVIGYKVYENLFEDEDPVGKHILINKVPTKVIGVMEEKGTDFTGEDQDLQVYIPLNTFMRRYNNVDYIRGAYLQIEDAIPLEEMKQRLKAFMRRLHNLKEEQKDDFFIFSMEDVLRTQEEGIRLVSILAIIASIVSFLIGGLGIFAIMLLSISERRLEIGIRRVVGSKKRYIIVQFLTESVIVALIGGISGVFVGLIITVAASSLGGFPIILNFGNIILSLFVSSIIGIIAGIYPAFQGTKYEPVKVLYS
jgi:putative ABC transport system permease protein